MLPFSPGYANGDTAAVVVAAVIAAIAAIVGVPIAAAAFATTGRRSPVILYGCGLLSAGAAAIHFAVMKMHFEE